ncbi:Beta-mannosidase [Hypsibius exemplaris]|uniref:Beta-mannosidase n=1 Tax=Hypsibius exemplaris TaxID=2072580 RepID=A0A1W0XEE0_HYPEX|nr:Beta-mannosidase [Hypsibius exemplaris]
MCRMILNLALIALLVSATFLKFHGMRFVSSKGDVAMKYVSTVVTLINALLCLCSACLSSKSSFAPKSMESITVAEDITNWANFILDLNGEWLVRSGPKNASTYAAQVPGNIYTDLVKNGTLSEDPYYRFNDEKYRWVSKLDWEFTRSFQVPSTLNYTKIILVCDGLDAIASISVNDQLVGTTVNQFVQYFFDVKKYLKLNSQNKITIRFKSPTGYASEQFYQHIWDRKYIVPPPCPPPEFHGDCHPNFIRKAQSSFSWDWGPSFPTVGIWKGIRIVGYNTVVIESVTVSPIWYQSIDAWAIKLQIYLRATDKTQRVAITTKIPELGLSQQEGVALESGASNVTFVYKIPSRVKKWWPNGYGGQKLYDLTVTVQGRFDPNEESKTVKVGFRTVELVQEPLPGGNVSGLSFYFRVNGVSIWAKGSNWIPAHSFQSSVTEDYVRWLLESTTAANMNMLRVWGGGYYETDFFYQTCDELGILIWQDFMFACAMYPTTEQFLATVREEVRSNVLRLQHHPSIVLWSANNENEVAYVENWYFTNVAAKTFKNDYIELYIDVIRDEFLKYEIDGGRPWIPSSPTNGKLTEEQGWIAKDPRSNLYGDAHFYSYLVDPWDWKLYPPTRFASEYGFQSWESVESLANYSLPEDRTYHSEFANHRQHHPLGQIEMLFEISRRFKLPSEPYGQRDFPGIVYLTQVNQAMALKTETEYYRRMQDTFLADSSGGTQGALYWQLNSIWPSASWSSIEFGGKWKMAHYYAKEFFEPVLLSPYVDGDQFLVTLINDNTTTVTGELHLEVYGFADGFQPKLNRSLMVKQKPQSATVVFTEDVKTLLQRSSCVKAADCFVVASLIVPGSDVVIGVPNVYFLGAPKDTTIPRASMKVAAVKQVDGSPRVFTISVEAAAVAPFIWLEATGIAGRFSRNGHMQYHPVEDVQFTARSDTNAADLRRSLKIMSLMDVY